MEVVASATDNNGNPITGTDSAELDAIAAEITVDTTVNNETGLMDIEGTTIDVPENSTVEITITDSVGNTVTTQASVNEDGSYSVENVDIRELVDGDLTIDAKAIDNNGQDVFAQTNDELLLVVELAIETSGSLEVFEKFLSNGSAANDGEPKDSGSIRITTSQGIQSVTIAGVVITLEALEASNASPISITTPEGNLVEIVGFIQVNDNAYQVDYTFELLNPASHPEQGTDELAKEPISLSVTDQRGNVESSEVEVSIVDDIPAAEDVKENIGVALTEAGISGFKAGFLLEETTAVNGSVSGEVLDADAYADRLTWGTPANGSQGSNYVFEDNEDFRTGDTIFTDQLIELGTFTHNNFPILSSGSILTSTVLEVKFTLVIDGVEQEISGQVFLEHDETPNTNSDPQAPENDDIIKITNIDFVQTYEINDRIYEFRIKGFLDQDGNIVDEIRTTEQASNSFKLFAELASTSDLPVFEGQVDYFWGADGAADEDPVIWKDIDAASGVIETDLGILTINPDGSYSYEVKTEARNKLQLGEVLVDRFTYVLKDADGDLVESSLEIHLNGVSNFITMQVTAPTVQEKFLPEGSAAGEGSTSASGQVVITSANAITSILIDGALLNQEQLNNLADTPFVLTTAAGNTVTLTGFEEGASGIYKLNYEFDLTSPEAHSAQGADELSKGLFDITVTSASGAEATTQLKANIIDDVPVAAETEVSLDVNLVEAKIGSFEAGFESFGAATGTNVDQDTFVDKLEWGTPTSGSQRSGYTFVDNEELRVETDIALDQLITLGVFTHNNFPISSGSSNFTGTDLIVRFNLVIEGELQAVEARIVLDHNETSNTNSTPTHPDNDDIVTITNVDATQTFIVNGREYQFQVKGFIDQNGNVVEQIRTTETRSNSFELVGQLVSTYALPSIEGQVDYNFGADGAAVADAVKWSGINAASGTIDGVYGSLTIQEDGSYTYIAKPDVLSTLKPNELVQDSFTYVLTDADGDQVQSVLTINLNGKTAQAGEVFRGDEGDNTIVGGSGNDLIIGGQGNDILFGGEGDDVFKWELNDQGSVGAPAVDVVKDFSIGNNVLDLKDLLSGESESTINDFILAEQDGNSTVLFIKTDGGLLGNPENADQKIVLEGVQMNGESSAEFLNDLISKGMLNIDN
ncbi:Serralysin C precursor [Nitrincola nitratireducens]|uniref:Serralysin C n=1 Tax=Nitrincola nitratireducens TaxID=1229521 RepID=W9UUZ7_9GAMM|nr:Serralysin C precursor [Nitrincola nitratireducens]